ncbi:MAG: metallophosphoesterase [Acidobacteriota bacterium]
MGKIATVRALLALALLSGSLYAQDEPFPIHDTRPVILNGPYLIAPSENGISVVWTTDTPCHSKILVGTDRSLNQTTEPSEHGLIPVGTVHSVRLRELEPGQTYYFRAVSTRVVKLKPYWPEKGLEVESPIFSFTLPDPSRSRVSFSFITDTQHEDLDRLKANLDLVDWQGSDFLVHGGDALSWVEGEEQLLSRFLDPIGTRLAHTRPLVFARGNHDMRGAYARELYRYTPTATGKFYYAFTDGPVHMMVIDTGEDKADDTNVYARLNDFKTYREEELNWLEKHVKESRQLDEASFRIVVMHDPFWGWVDGENDKWTELANRAQVDLVIAGHHHRFSRIQPGERGNEYPILVVGQDQVAKVEATRGELRVQITGKDGEEVDSFVLSPRTVEAAGR